MKPTGAVSLLLPFPPSVNSLFFNVRGRGRVKTKRYSDWIVDAGMAAKAQMRLHDYRVEGPFGLEAIAYRPDKRKRDLDNLLKPILDLLGPKTLGVIEDDHLCQSIKIEWQPRQRDRQGVRVLVISTRERT